MIYWDYVSTNFIKSREESFFFIVVKEIQGYFFHPLGIWKRHMCRVLCREDGDIHSTDNLFSKKKFTTKHIYMRFFPWKNILIGILFSRLLKFVWKSITVNHSVRSSNFEQSTIVWVYCFKFMDIQIAVNWYNCFAMNNLQKIIVSTKRQSWSVLSRLNVQK